MQKTTRGNPHKERETLGKKTSRCLFEDGSNPTSDDMAKATGKLDIVRSGRGRRRREGKQCPDNKRRRGRHDGIIDNMRYATYIRTGSHDQDLWTR